LTVNSACFYNELSTRLSRRLCVAFFAALPVFMRESESARLTRKKGSCVAGYSEEVASYKIQEQYS